MADHQFGPGDCASAEVRDDQFTKCIQLGVAGLQIRTQPNSITLFVQPVAEVDVFHPAQALIETVSLFEYPAADEAEASAEGNRFAPGVLVRIVLHQILISRTEVLRHAIPGVGSEQSRPIGMSVQVLESSVKKVRWNEDVVIHKAEDVTRGDCGSGIARRRGTAVPGQGNDLGGKPGGDPLRAVC